MTKTLRSIMKRDKEHFKVPKSVQDVIPIRKIYPDGIFLVGKDKYSRSYKFTDINFAVAGEEDQEAMLEEYAGILNTLDSSATTKITVNNRKMNRSDFEDSVLMKYKDDGLDSYRYEYNEMLTAKVKESNSMIQEKYVTISTNKRNIEEARTYFARIGSELIARFARLGSSCMEMDVDERLRVLHDFYRVGEENEFRFDLAETMKKGHSFKDYICPDTFEFRSDHFMMGDRYGRVLFLREYGSTLNPDFITAVMDLNQNMILSIDIIPIPTGEAVRDAETRLLGIETNISQWQRRQNANNNFSAVVPYDLEQQRKYMKEYLDELTEHDSRELMTVLTVVHTADSLEQLNSDTKALLSVMAEKYCQGAVLKYQQMDGLNTALPIGVRRIDALRTLTTGSCAALMPFYVQDIKHKDGIYYGQNKKSKSMIIADRRQLMNGNSFILGTSGGGKSFAAKNEIVNQMLGTDADILIIDPDSEYSKLVKALGGEVIQISATSPNHINAMDLNKDYGDGANPVILKSEFVMSLIEQLLAGSMLNSQEKSIIDRCVSSVYREYSQNGYSGKVPTLEDLRIELLNQPEEEGKSLALALELFSNGSLNTFAKETNVDTENRLVCYDILELGKQLAPIGMLVVLDSIFNRITENRAKGRSTFVYIDEIYVLFQQEHSANFLYKLWKRVRKYGACMTGITQNVSDLLQSHTARTMLSNSEFIIMLNQSPLDAEDLAKLFHISDAQMSAMKNAGVGSGLLKVGSALIPFENNFPKNMKLYTLMSSKVGESE